MSKLVVAATMLRFRVATLLLPFFLLAPAIHGALAVFRWQYVAGVVALFSSYIVATCLNDVFDVEIDRVNHPGSADRPLVTGAATRGEMLALAALLAGIALLSAAATGPFALAVLMFSLLLNIAYSVPPLRLTSRALPAPVVLGIAYVAVPYAFGLAAAGVQPNAGDLAIAAAFVVLFIGRMLLKDFRDRQGDALFGKRTFLLVYGKRATVIGVLACVLAGNAILVPFLLTSSVLLVAMQSFFAVIVYQLYRLSKAQTLEEERTAIALGARMGNAVVLSLLGYTVMRGAGAGDSERDVFVVAIAGMFWLTFAVLARRATRFAAGAT